MNCTKPARDCLHTHIYTRQKETLVFSAEVLCHSSTVYWVGCVSEMNTAIFVYGLPWWLRWWRSHLQCRRPEFEPSTRVELPRGSGRSPVERKWLPTPVFLPGEFHGQRSLVGHSPWGCKESDTTEQLTLSLFHICVCMGWKVYRRDWIFCTI